MADLGVSIVSDMSGEPGGCLARWWRDRGGVTSLEYGIIASILGLELVNIFHGFGVSLTTLFTRVGQSI